MTNFSRVITLKTYFLSNLIIFLFLLFNLSNLSTYSRGFFCFLQPYWTGTKCFNAKGIYIRQVFTQNAYIEDFSSCAVNLYTEDVSTESTYIGSNYIRSICSNNVCTGAGICIGGACIWDAGIDVAGSTDTYAEKACIGYAWTSNICAKSAGMKGICDSAYKPNKSFVKNLKLLVESISKILVSFCLCLQVIFDRIFYCHFIYWICLIVYSLF